jgi:hypothetical protein
MRQPLEKSGWKAFGCFDVIHAFFQCVFKDTRRYFSEATTPCVVAYGYARIRRLVRLDPGLYRFPATAYQWSGLVARGVFSKVQKRCQSDFLSELDGGCAQGASARRQC